MINVNNYAAGIPPAIDFDQDFTNASECAKSTDSATSSTRSSTFFTAETPNSINPRLSQYFAQEAAQEQSVVTGFEKAHYGCLPLFKAPLIIGHGDREYAPAALIIDPEMNRLAGQFFETGGSNMFNPDWREIIEECSRLNGGLGDSENGFLAWSKEGHFIRLRNPGLTPEQNRKIAAMSLQSGWAIEDLPGDTAYCSFLDKGINESVEDLFSSYDKELTAFLQNPEDGISVTAGRDHYIMEMNQETGVPVSYHYRKAGGLRGWMQKNLKWVNVITDGISTVSSFFPGAGTIVAGVSQGLKTAAGWLAKGNISLGEAVSNMGGFVTGKLGTLKGALGKLFPPLLSNM